MIRREDLNLLVSEWARKFYSKRLFSIQDLFGVDKAIVGMVHLLPLPGAPAYEGYSIDAIVDQAVREARIYEENGVNGVIVENMWDLPYYSGAARIPPEEIAAHAVVAREVAKSVSIPIGITVIHNGGRVALAIAKASGAKFIRVCLYTGAAVWDTGELDSGVTADIFRLRKHLYAEDVKFFVDVVKKHSVLFPGVDLETHVTWSLFYLADALIVTGRMTGEPPSPETVRKVKEMAGDVPVLVGSGLSLDNAEKLLKYADGAIVGTYFKVSGVTQNPVDPDRVRKFMEVIRRLRNR
ncbi:MAG: BtpA/SgcQ family protein [Sulfolobales archaeon]|nr:BtpA/SgcQ family protein [Sulfolobales archaeon]MCX8208646.1 BtpA/SgcQ family protein [Sulfolobales archaeon]MDW8010782.1 BtpA/SgcQ family protein [Sulfolobales archaeon]